jgi:hypothetical protein
MAIDTAQINSGPLTPIPNTNAAPPPAANTTKRAREDDDEAKASKKSKNRFLATEVDSMF